MLDVVSFFNVSPPPGFYTLSLHDALPILGVFLVPYLVASYDQAYKMFNGQVGERLDKQFQDKDRKSTRLNSSHEWISYAVFCLKKKTNRPRHSTAPAPNTSRPAER